MLLYIDSQITPLHLLEVCFILSTLYILPVLSFLHSFLQCSFDLVEIFKYLNFFLIPFMPLVLQCIIFRSAHMLFVSSVSLEGITPALTSVYGLHGTDISPWIQGWAWDLGLAKRNTHSILLVIVTD